ncbi:MAG TPA: hypothetical protein VJ927_11840 [Actinomycetota bacterium]|nr:hypothetical protein [Actinomycetota bacterium]
MPESSDHNGGNRVFDFIGARDLIVLGVAGAATAVALAVTHWWKSRRGRRSDEPRDGSGET